MTALEVTVPQQLNVQDLRIDSDAFPDHGAIPALHTGDDRDVSPAVGWSGTPAGARSFALVVHDPDAPLVDGFTHWVLYNIPADVTSLSEGDSRFTSGVNSLGQSGYIGPAPPPGHGNHHYYFWIYALDDDLDVEPGLSREELLSRIEDHTIEQARTVGVYSR